MGFGDLLSDSVREIKETYEEFYQDRYAKEWKNKLDIILKFMDALRFRLDLQPEINYNLIEKRGDEEIDTIYQEIDKKVSRIFEILIMSITEVKDRMRKDGVKVHEWTKEDINKFNKLMGKDILKFKE